jgi:lysophospholipase L1-like esterase
MFWYEEEITRLENERLKQTEQPETIFYGSSSIRLWTTLNEDFKDFKPVNLGFGGSTLAACVWFFERIMTGYQPKRFVLYAGDNDLGDGRHPEEVFIFFQQLASRVKQYFGDIPCYFISIKPSLSRWYMVSQFKFTNGLISKEIEKNMPNWHWIDVFNPMLDSIGQPNAEYFLNDGLHLTEKGYRVWADVVQKRLRADI